MRFLVFNVIVAGALFYLLTGGDTQIAKNIWESEEAKPVKARVEAVIAETQSKFDALKAETEVLKEKLAEAEKEAYQGEPEKESRKPKPEQVADNPLPPLDGEQQVETAAVNTVNHAEAVPAGGYDRVAEASNDPVDIKPRDRATRKKELYSLVSDMERMFADKLARY